MTDLPDVKLRALVNFPVRVTGRVATSIEKINGQWYIDHDVSGLVQNDNISADEVAQSRMTIWNSVTDAYETVPYALAATSGVSSIDGHNGALDIGDGLTFNGDTLEVDVGAGLQFTGGVLEPDIATLAEALAGTSNTTLMTPLLVAQSFPFRVSAYGAVGDGSTDDRAAVQSAIDAASAAGGGYVTGLPGKTYRIVIDGVIATGLNMKPGVTLFLNGATFNLENTGQAFGIRMQDDTHILGPGTLAVTVSVTPAGSQSIYHGTVSLGEPYGQITDVAALGPYLNAKRWSIRKVKITSVKADGHKIVGLGGFSQGVIEDIYFPDDSNSVGCINFDWGTVGNVATGDIPGTRTRFDAGTAYTVHPHNIDIRRIIIGAMSNAASCPIRFSGVHDIRLDGFVIEQCREMAVFHTGGDMSYEFADNDTKRRRHQGIVIKNGRIEYAGPNGHGIVCDSYGDNLATAIAGGYVALLGSAFSHANIVFENIFAGGALTTSVGDGCVLNFCDGIYVKNCSFTGFNRGIVIGNNARRCKIIGGEVTQSDGHGIYLNGGSVPPNDITIDGVTCRDNSITGAGAGIHVVNGARHAIRNNQLGADIEGNQNYGVYLDGPTEVEVTGNHVQMHATGGKAYRMGSTTGYGVLRLFANNTASSSVTAADFYDGVNITPYALTHTASKPLRTFRALIGTMTAGVTPPTAAYLIGDTIEFSDPVTGGYKGTVCTVSGPPGTWKNYGLIT